MSAHNGAVHHPILHIRVICKVLKHPLPYAVITPTGQAFIDTVPVPILSRQQSPLRSTSVNPSDCFDKASAFLLVPNIGSRVSFQKIPPLGPLFITQFHGCHPTTLTVFPQMSTEP